MCLRRLLKAEGWGLALMEAMAIGCPVVSTSVGGTPEASSGWSRRALVAEGDASALSSALKRVLSDERYRRELVEAGTRRVYELTPDRVATAWLSLIDEAQCARRADGPCS